MPLDKNNGALWTLGAAGALAIVGAIASRRGSRSTTQEDYDQAYDYGFSRGYDAAIYQDREDVRLEYERQHGEFPQTFEEWEDAWKEAASEAEQNGRQFTPFEHYAHDYNSAPQEQSENLWEQFNAGVSEGIEQGVRDALSEHGIR